MNKKSFLYHVAGLRGIAILFVVLFHFTYGNSSLPFRVSEGYRGVDVFFVIMGFFLVRSFVNRKELSFITFIKGKIERLLIPLAFLILITLSIALFLLDYEYLKTSAVSGAFSLLACSNYQLITGMHDYFSTESSNAFLHTWYISVAFQLFVFSSVYFLLFKKLSRSKQIIILSVLAAVSFSVQYFVDVELLTKLGVEASVYPYLASYYAMVPRVWEFLAGGAILLLPELRNSTKVHAVLSGLGLGLIVFPIISKRYLVLDEMCIGISVVVGAMLVIKYGGTKGNLVNWGLDNKLMGWFGRVSYSLFLVHMPILVLFQGGTVWSVSIELLFLLITVSIIAAWAFHYYIEQRRFSLRVAAMICLLSFLFTTVLASTNGLKEYWNAHINSIEYEKYADLRPCCEQVIGNDELQPTVYYRNDDIILTTFFKSKLLEKHGDFSRFSYIGQDGARPSFVLVGDSHAVMNYAGLDNLCKQLGISGVMYNSVFLPLKDRAFGEITDSYSISEEKYNAFIRWLEKKEEIRYVVAIFSWKNLKNKSVKNWSGKDIKVTVDENVQCFENFVNDVRKLNRKVIIFTASPYMESNKVRTYARIRARWGLESSPHQDAYVISQEKYDNQWGNIIVLLNELEKRGECSVLDVSKYFFKNGNFYAVDGTRVNFIDSNHIGADVSIEMMKYLGADFCKAMELPSYTN